MTDTVVAATGAATKVPPPVFQNVGSRPTRVVVGLVSKRVGRSGALWGYVFGGYALTSLYGYAAAYKTQAQRNGLAHAFGSNVGINALIGPARAINTIPGFVAWRSLGVLSLVGAIWGLLTATRVMRGDEEAGRWELLLSGQTTRRGAAVQALSGLGAGLVALVAVTSVLTVIAGHLDKAHIGLSASLFFAVALVASTAIFFAVGAFTSQLSNTRRRAAWMAAGFFGVAYALRMVADSDPGIHWLVWLSPLGWVEELRPLTGSRPLALVPIVALVGVLVSGTVVLAGRRDLGAAVLASHDSGPTRTKLLGGPTVLALRLMRPVAAGWLAATAAFAVLIGMVAESATQAVGSSKQVNDFLGNLGLNGSLVNAYLGLTFLMVALMVIFTAAGQVTATRSEEADGYLDNLLFRPVSRVRWLAGRVGIALSLLVVSGLLAGVCTWLGAASQHAGLRFFALVGAGMNIVPPAVFVVGLGVLTFGAWPRRTAAVVYGFVAWSFLMELIGGVIKASHWLMDTSVLYHMAPAPAVAPDWAANTALVGIGLALAAIGALCFQARDLQAA